jgi:hypothetical protein
MESCPETLNCVLYDNIEKDSNNKVKWVRPVQDMACAGDVDEI